MNKFFYLVIILEKFCLACLYEINTTTIITK